MLPNSICTSASHRAWSFEAVSLCLAKLGPPRKSRLCHLQIGRAAGWRYILVARMQIDESSCHARHPEPAKLAPPKPVLFWHHQLQHPCPDSSLGFCGPWCSGWAQGRAATHSLGPARTLQARLAAASRSRPTEVAKLKTYCGKPAIDHRRFCVKWESKSKPTPISIAHLLPKTFLIILS